MFRISKLADYSTVIMSYLATYPATLHNARDVMQHTHIALPTISKILKRLVKANLVISKRGIHGGYQLTLPASEISIADILMVFDGPFALTECSDKHQRCALENRCLIRNSWRTTSELVYQSLAKITLSDMLKKS